jgi:hypothetical protein
MSWKRLTKVDGTKIDVNMDLVANIQIYEGGATLVYFNYARGDISYFEAVKESPDDIQLMQPLLSS